MVCFSKRRTPDVSDRDAFIIEISLILQNYSCGYEVEKLLLLFSWGKKESFSSSGYPFFIKVQTV